jgi:hypothetical protein
MCTGTSVIATGAHQVPVQHNKLVILIFRAFRTASVRLGQWRIVSRKNVSVWETASLSTPQKTGQSTTISNTLVTSYSEIYDAINEIMILFKNNQNNKLITCSD